MDVDVDRVLQARADIGSRLENLDVIQTLLEDENVELQTSLSENLDVDLVEAISQFDGAAVCHASIATERCQHHCSTRC